MVTEVLVITIYILVGILIYFIEYCVACKEYKESNSILKFKYWYRQNRSSLDSLVAMTWPCAIPLLLICMIFEEIKELINKHYGI